MSVFMNVILIIRKVDRKVDDWLDRTPPGLAFQRFLARADKVIGALLIATTLVGSATITHNLLLWLGWL